MKIPVLLTVDFLLLIAGATCGVYGKSLLFDPGVERRPAALPIAALAIGALIVAVILIASKSRTRVARPVLVACASALIVAATVLTMVAAVKFLPLLVKADGSRFALGIVCLLVQPTTMLIALYLTVSHLRRRERVL
jgi:hypothetical protein